LISNARSEKRFQVVNYEFYRYDADHGFGNETGERYNQKAAKLAWRRSLDFLVKHLK